MTRSAPAASMTLTCRTSSSSSPAPAVDSPRRADLARRLGEVRERIAAAARVCGRSPSEVTLIAVTKGHPASDVALLAELGCLEIGENRAQEAAAKAADLAESAVAGRVRWHMIGQCQRRRAALVTQWADVVHSLDRPALLDSLAGAAERGGRQLDVLVQVALEPSDLPSGAAEPASGAAVTEGERGGAHPSQVPLLVEGVLARPSLRLRGVMAVLPLGLDPLPPLATLAAVSTRVRTMAPEATWISAGMSADLEPAIAMGATHVRIGSALLGGRPALG